MLLDANADVNLQDNGGKTVYDFVKTESVKKLLSEAMKPKTNVLSTISLGDWSKETTFRFVLERHSPGDEENKPSRDVLATI